MASFEVNNKDIDGYYEMGKRGALSCVAFGLIICGCLGLSSFAIPWYKTTPYYGYDIIYYFDQVTYSPNIIDDIPFNQCNDNQYNKDCHKLKKISSNILCLNLSLVGVIVILCVFIFRLIVSKTRLIKNFHLFLIFFGILFSWILLTASIHFFMKSFPNTKYCSYNGDNTGCKWYTSITILLISTSILTILASIIIGLIAPFCRIFKFLPFFGTNHDDVDDVTIHHHAIKQQRITSIDEDDRININDNDNDNDKQIGLIKNINNNNYNPENRKKGLCYITIPECCSMLILSLGLIFINIILILSYFNEWYPSNYDAQQYVNNKWNNAKCINLNGYFDEPIIYKQEYFDKQCSFSYPDSNGKYNNTYWSCCNISTCSKAFNYSKLIKNYNNDLNGNCLIDMKSITKASCHPNDAWFVEDNFNISQNPQQKQNKLAVCALFCKKTYDDCYNLIWNDDRNLTIKEIWTKYDDFCEEGLGTKIRYEAFTDHCFAGSPDTKNKLFISFLIVIISICNQS